ncbi:MAG: hypothetical protein K2J77_02750 [Oscillospiraceae bacterium]|nr:hypothetical protein [Oscillospiraceae bacterium]
MKHNPKILAAVLCVSLIGGCAAKSGGESSQENSSTTTASVPTISSAPISEASSAPEESKGEPTFLIGLDGKAILTGEITRLENTEKTAETLTEDDLYADVYCEGFTYMKEPAAAYYSTYKNPELFDSYKFIGEAEENKNEWRRVNVGDEICGLKVKAAQTHFMVHDWEEYKFPARYFRPDNSFCELEGTVELEGYLQVTAEAALYQGVGGKLYFYPCESKLPVTPPYNPVDDEIGFASRLGNGMVYDNVDIMMFTELDDIYLGEFADEDCDLDGLGKGDVAYARVTLDNIQLWSSRGKATLREVKLLSDILAHNGDETELRQPAPTL